MSAEQKPIDIILIRHGETIDNRRRLTSGGDSDPPLLPDGLEKAKKSAEIYRTLLESGDISKTTPIIISSRIRAKQTAEAMTGQHPKDFIVNEALDERKFGRWVSILTERLYKEFRKIKDSGNANAKDLDIGETIDEHKSRVKPALDKIIEQAKTSGPVVVFSHSGTMRRIAELLTGKGDVKVDGAVPYRARSLDGGQTWDIKKLGLENGNITERPLEPKEKAGEEQKTTLDKILKKPDNKISLTPVGDNKIFKIAGLKSQDIKPLAEDLGKLLIGEHYSDRPSPVRNDNHSISITLSPKQAEILETFAQLQNINIVPAIQESIPHRMRSKNS